MESISQETIKKLIGLYKSIRSISVPGHDSGWVHLGIYGNLLIKSGIEYKPMKLAMFIKQCGIFEIITLNNNPANKLIRLKKDIPQTGEPAEKSEVEEVNDINTENVEILLQTEETHYRLSFDELDKSNVVPNISPEQLSLFNSLKKAKEQDWETFSKRDYVGIWKSIIEKYPETAHFIYELIQNADDAQASEAAIILYNDKLVFKHDGKRQFTLTDVSDIDSHMGDINSITSVACSTKKDEEQTIGKFGVGFKSVFQYTEAPSIYDDTYWFRIDNYIIPNLLEKDNNLRNSGETLFEIPFKNPEKAYREILDRLTNLKMPVLFLPHVKRIIWKIDGEDQVHEYSKDILQSNTRRGISYDLCRVNDYENKYVVYLFNRDLETSEGNYNISVGYFLNSDGSLNIDVVPKIYCFFPTSETFEGCFVSHAPFLLTDNRDSIKTFEEVNSEFLRGIAKLAAEALVCLKDIGQNRNKLLLEDESEDKSDKVKLLINDNIFRLVNIKSNDARNTYLKECYTKVIKKYKIILNRSLDYVDFDKILLTTADLQSLISSTQIHYLYNNEEYDFVYAKGYRSDLRNVSEDIGLKVFDNETLAEKLTPVFMKHQSPEWIKRLLFYIREKARTLWVLNDNSARHISTTKYYNSSSNTDSWENLKFRFAPIGKTTDGQWISPYTLYQSEANFVLPFQELEDMDPKIFGKILDNELYCNNKEFFDQLGLKRPTITDYIKSTILPHYQDSNLDENTQKKDFVLITKTFCNKSISSDLEIELSCYWLVMGKNSNGTRKLCEIPDLFLCSKKLLSFLGASDKYYYFDSEYYSDILEDVTMSDVVKLLIELGMKSIPDVNRTELCCTKFYSEGYYPYTSTHIKLKSGLPYNIETAIKSLPRLSETYHVYFYDYELEGYNIKKISKEWSFILWDIMSEIGCWRYHNGIIKYYVYRGKTEKSLYIESMITSHLKNDKWIYLDENSYCRPCDITIDQFHELGYSHNSWEEYLDFCKDEYDSIFNKDEREKAEEAQKQKEAEEEERTELIAQAQEKGLNVNDILKNALESIEDSSAGYASLITSENREAIHKILNHLSNEELNKLADKLDSGENEDALTHDVESTIPVSIVNNIKPLESITNTVGEENLPVVAEHVGEFMSWYLNEEEAPSMVRRIINYIGKKIYEQYLIKENIDYVQISDDISDCDFMLDGGSKYVRVISTLKSIADNKFPVGLSAGQNSFLRNQRNIQIRLIRISLTDICVLPEYNNIIDLYGKSEDPNFDSRLSSKCEELAEKYWEDSDIYDFDSVSPEYSIKIERKN